VGSGGYGEPFYVTASPESDGFGYETGYGFAVGHAAQSARSDTMTATEYVSELFVKTSLAIAGSCR